MIAIEVRITEHRERLTADSCALPRKSLPWWLIDATVWGMPRTATRAAISTGSFHDDVAGAGDASPGIGVGIVTESPLAQMKPGFIIVALLTHFQLPLDRSWHSALAPFLEPA